MASFQIEVRRVTDSGVVPVRFFASVLEISSESFFILFISSSMLYGAVLSVFFDDGVACFLKLFHIRSGALSG